MSKNDDRYRLAPRLGLAAVLCTGAMVLTSAPLAHAEPDQGNSNGNSQGQSQGQGHGQATSSAPAPAPASAPAPAATQAQAPVSTGNQGN
ncbi:MAG TPA: hypothetical protein VLA70_08925, partial [Nocardioides sp.]|nr:hypothetical protein [Nocardioides sp.]